MASWRLLPTCDQLRREATKLDDLSLQRLYFRIPSLECGKLLRLRAELLPQIIYLRLCPTKLPLQFV